jgi:hypothetical protein
MRIARQPHGKTLIAATVEVAFSALVRTQGRTEVTINDTGTQAENVTSSQDGSIYFGSPSVRTIQPQPAERIDASAR